MSAKEIRMKRSPGGRRHVLYVRVTEEEDRRIRNRAAQEGLSAQRFLLETALSGSTQSAALRRHAAVEMRAARAILRGVANNLNQLAKWSNANHSLPDSLDGIVEDLARAVRTVDTTSARLANAFADPVGERGKPTAPS
jgi:Bacterial mobilisation protein (MobC)